MSNSQTKKSANLLLSIFLILTFILCIGGNQLYRYQKKHITIEKHNELAAISNLKVEQIAEWRKERLQYTRIIFNNHAVITHIHEYIQGINTFANLRIIKEWINTYKEDSEYSMIALLDPSETIIFNSNSKGPISYLDKQSIEQAKSDKEIIFSDLFRYNDQNIYMNLVVPLYLDPIKKEGFSGVVLLRIDPYKYLYPNILKWPIQGRSNEVILVRQERDSVLYLSELQHQSNSALRMRMPMSNKKLLVVQAINGKTGILEGVDYRGIKVLGDTKKVPDSPWYVVTKIDSDEIYYPIVTMATWIFIITFLLILISALIIYFVWKKQTENEAIINQQLLQDLVDEQTIDLRKLNQLLQNDIAERKQVEEKLRESEQRLSFHFENSPLAVVEWDADFVVTQWSKEAEHIFGWKASETLGVPIASLNMIYIDDIPIVNHTMERLTSGFENVVVSSNRNYTKDGTVIETVWYNSIFFNEEGKMTSVMSLVDDITERNKVDNALRKLSQAVEQSPVSIVITDPDGVIEYGNPKVCQITGYTLEEVLGKKPSLFKSEATPVKTYDELWQTITAGKEWQGEFQNKKKNGDIYWEACSISPILDNQGNITHYLAIKEDITERKKVEEELKKAKTDLEIRVMERTAELAKSEEGFRKLNEKLEQSVDERTAQLLSANKELEAFSYSVSHDLRAPLRSIDGWSMALLEDCADQLDKQGKEYLDRVRSETQRMGYLIDDLLKLSRVSRTELKKVNVDLSGLARGIINRIMKTKTDRRSEFIIQPGMFTFGDPHMLEIALTNLLDNAYKFTSKQSLAQIEFGQSMIGDQPTYWVRDNGVGFDMSYSKNLFGAFQRMHKQSDFPGTGIGLATVQRIIHRHEGTIWAESAVNQGTTFYFTLIQ